jgi:hypothetical protein
LMDTFNLEELRTLCFELRLNYEDLGGDNRAGKIRELILTMQARLDGLPQLVDAIRRERGAVI